MGITNNIPPSRLIQPGVCTSATRPVSPFEGQAIYTTDLDTLEIWNGSAWRIVGAATATSGSVLQVVHGSTTTQVTTTSTTYIDTNLTATITPKSTSSKIFICVSQGLGTAASAVITLQLLRDSTNVITHGHALYSAANFILGYSSFTALDSPATTSAIIYKVQGKVNSATNYFNFNDSNGIQRSSITLMEIAG